MTVTIASIKTDMTRYIRQSPEAMLNLARELVLGVELDVAISEPENEERTA